MNEEQLKLFQRGTDLGIVVNPKVFKGSGEPTTPTIIASAIKDAMRPYSMAVAPDLSEMNLRITVLPSRVNGYALLLTAKVNVFRNRKAAFLQNFQISNRRSDGRQHE